MTDHPNLDPSEADSGEAFRERSGPAIRPTQATINDPTRQGAGEKRARGKPYHWDDADDSIIRKHVKADKLNSKACLAEFETLKGRDAAPSQRMIIARWNKLKDPDRQGPAAARKISKEKKACWNKDHELIIMQHTENFELSPTAIASVVAELELMNVHRADRQVRVHFREMAAVRHVALGAFSSGWDLSEISSSEALKEHKISALKALIEEIKSHSEIDMWDFVLLLAADANHDWNSVSTRIQALTNVSYAPRDLENRSLVLRCREPIPPSPQPPLAAELPVASPEIVWTAEQDAVVLNVSQVPKIELLAEREVLEVIQRGQRLRADEQGDGKHGRHTPEQLAPPPFSAIPSVRPRARRTPINVDNLQVTPRPPGADPDGFYEAPFGGEGDPIGDSGRAVPARTVVFDGAEMVQAAGSPPIDDASVHSPPAPPASANSMPPVARSTPAKATPPRTADACPSPPNVAQTIAVCEQGLDLPAVSSQGELGEGETEWQHDGVVNGGPWEGRLVDELVRPRNEEDEENRGSWTTGDDEKIRHRVWHETENGIDWGKFQEEVFPDRAVIEIENRWNQLKQDPVECWHDLIFDFAAHSSGDSWRSLDGRLPSGGRKAYCYWNANK